MHPCTNIWLNVSQCAGCLYLSASADIWPLLVFGEQSSFKLMVSCTILTFDHSLSLFNQRQVWALKPVQKFNMSPLYPIRNRFWCVWDHFAFVTHNHVRVSTTQLVWREVSHSSMMLPPPCLTEGSVFRSESLPFTPANVLFVFSSDIFVSMDSCRFQSSLQV